MFPDGIFSAEAVTGSQGQKAEGPVSDVDWKGIEAEDREQAVDTQEADVESRGTDVGYREIETDYQKIENDCPETDVDYRKTEMYSVPTGLHSREIPLYSRKIEKHVQLAACCLRKSRAYLQGSPLRKRNPDSE